MQKKKVLHHKRSADYPATLTAYVYDFLEHLRSKKYSPVSVKKRQTDYNCLLDYLTSCGIQRFQDIDFQALDNFHTHMKTSGYADNTISSAITSVRRLFTWLEETGHLFENPARKLTGYSAQKKKLGLVLTTHQIKKLMAIPNLTTPLGLRDRAILETLYATGIRLSECQAITIFDIDLEARTIKATGKGSKQRLLPLGTYATKYITHYLDNARSKLNTRSRGSTDHTALWLSYYGAPLGKQPIQILVRTAAKTANLPEGTDTHTLRRTCATHLLQGGAHPYLVSQILGHADIATLSHYLKTTITDLMETHSQTSPGK